MSMVYDPISDYLKKLPGVADADLIVGRTTDEINGRIEELNRHDGGAWKLYEWQDGRAISVFEEGRSCAAHIVKIKS